MANRDRHRRFGNVRRRESGRYQIRYPGPDGRMRTGPETYERRSDADRALVMIEAQIRSGEWTDPERGKVKLADYGSAWITERPGLRPRTMDLYRWLLRKHVEPYLGGVPVGRLSTRQIREWRANLLANGVSVSVTAKAYRLLRAIMTTAGIHPARDRMSRRQHYHFVSEDLLPHSRGLSAGVSNLSPSIFRPAAGFGCPPLSRGGFD